MKQSQINFSGLFIYSFFKSCPRPQMEKEIAGGVGNFWRLYEQVLGHSLN